MSEVPLTRENVFRDYIELTKPRICILALAMAAFGYGMATPPGAPVWTLELLWALLGIGAVGAACGVLNQYVEREFDSQMARTKNRPLPAGRIPLKNALLFGIALTVVGEGILVTYVNGVTTLLAALTLFLYLAVYTPSKRVNSLSTLIGAVPGAMPPLLGWTAATGTLGYEGILLFVILFFWQIPHFLAIGWMYKEDYSKANFPILTVIDSAGKLTSLQIVLYSLILLPVTLLAGITGVSGHWYLVGAAILGLWFLFHGFKLASEKNKLQARRLFLVSIAYLPILGLLMVWDRL